MDKPSTRRCAIYTRKSSEEGLDQTFNSLDAQREACAAYIASQIGEGLTPVRQAYDDGGLSGGNMERPGLQALLTDIRDRKIDTVVVYKVDRLTRSLSDFARIVDVFDEHGVSFVSITQQFNTTTSMGRLTLNMLLSFAQFEREVTGERIRDKIAASKRKGMWMGGNVPLGYEADDRTLKIVPSEAETVRTLFNLYLEHKNVHDVKAQADRRGLVTKVRHTADEGRRGGRSFSRGHIYCILNNPLYIGKIAHKGNVYDGLHAAIIGQDVWEAAQATLTAQTPRRTRDRATEASPLAGKLFDETGDVLTPSHSVKKGRRYRYYVSRRLVTGRAKPVADKKTRGLRLPAGEIETIVQQSLCSLLNNPSLLTTAAREAGVEAHTMPGLLTAVPEKPTMDFVERVDLAETSLAIKINCSTLLGHPAPSLRHTVPLSIRRRGVETRMVIRGEGSLGNGKPDPVLIRGIARAHDWFDGLVAGRYTSIKAIAAEEGVTDRYVGQLLPLAFLSPEMVEAILAGTQPQDLTLDTIVKRVDLPLDWSEQALALGFA